MQKFWHNFSPHQNKFSTRKYVLLSMHTLSTRLDVFCNQSEIFPCGKIFTPQKHVSGVCNKYGLLGCSHVRSHEEKKHVHLFTPHLATNMMYVTTLLATRQTCTLSRRHWCWELGNMSRVFSKFKFSQSRPN